MLLRDVGSCCAKFETGQNVEPTTPNIYFWSWGEWWKFYKILEEEKTELLPKNTAKHEQEHNLTDISFVIRSTSLFFNEYLRRRETICHFQARAIARRRKAWFYFRMSGIIFAAKHN